MYDLLSDLRIVEAASFVAAPLCALNLARLGADVIRIDPIGGGPDAHRWPITADGTSLYWQGLNKAKRSVALNLRSSEGRDLAIAIATAAGDGAGLLVTNYPVDGFLSHEVLSRRRADMITVRVTGWGDGSSATDATVNSTLGVSMMTGPEGAGDAPVNNVIPPWDIAVAGHGAFALLAAERRRRATGLGSDIRIALGDVAMSVLSDLGMIAEAELSGEDRPRMGNQFFGGFGKDFTTADGKKVFILALTERHWLALSGALDIREEVRTIERDLGVDFAKDESARFANRDALNDLVERTVANIAFAELERIFRGTAVCWAPCNRLTDVIGPGRLISDSNDLFSMTEFPGGARYHASGAPVNFGDLGRKPPRRSPALGEHTDEILSSILGLSSREIGQLHDAGLAAGPAAGTLR
ncbi:MAG: CoA transferase [Rhizobiaceae bacterium]|nr:CoA transferase [Rhizobiaceae bacterium]